jgi:hypothetical protein
MESFEPEWLRYSSLAYRRERPMSDGQPTACALSAAAQEQYGEVKPKRVTEMPKAICFQGWELIVTSSLPLSAVLR